MTYLVAALFPWLILDQLLDGERAAITCDDGRCELRRAGSIGWLSTVGRFSLSGVVGSSANCHRELEVPDDSVGSERTVTVCQPGLWLLRWDGPPGSELDRRSVDDVMADQPLPQTAVFVPLTERAHERWRPDPLADLEARHLDDGPWAVDYQTSFWVQPPLPQLAIAVEVAVVALPFWLQRSGPRKRAARAARSPTPGEGGPGP